VTLQHCLRALLLAGVGAAFAVANVQSGEQCIYSNVEYNEEGGDLLGTELDFTANEGRVDGHVKIYQGGCGDPVSITGSLSNDKLQVSGRSDAYGRIEITGTVRRTGFEGILRLEKAQPRKIRLKKIAKAHC
jgi:hypothetical protein